MKHYAVFGNPIKHSISPSMHNAGFKLLQIQANYTKHKLENGQKLRQTFEALNLSGANITVPFKEVAFSQCDEVRGIAKEIKAVNTLIKEEDKLIGYNTDAPGFIKAIEEFFPLKSALIIGAGGTAKAIACALLQKGLHVNVVNRSAKRVEGFKNLPIQTFTWENFTPTSYEIIINTTSAGLNDNALPLPKELLEQSVKKARYAFEVIYNKPTPFFLTCKENNLITKNGLDMLLYQGVLAFELFTSVKADEKLIRVMRQSLKHQITN